MLPSVLLIVMLIVDWLVFPMSAAAQEEEAIHGPVRRMIVKHKASAVVQTYNDAGALVETVTRTFVDGDHAAEQAEEKVIYTYDPQGHRTADLFQDTDGETYPLRRYAYDAGGNKAAEVAYHMCGTFSSLHLYTYDEHHKLIEDVWYENRTISKKVYSYDRSGRLLKSTWTQNGALHALTHYRYDGRDRIVEELAYGSGDSLIGKILWRYDEAGRKIVDAALNALDEIQDRADIYTYEDDRFGNWIRRTTVRLKVRVDDEGMPIEDQVDVTERAIEYRETS